MPGKVHSHWVCLKSHADPVASDVESGMVCLGTDGASIYMTIADGTTTAISGAAIHKSIPLDDNTSSEYHIYQGSDSYIKVDTVDGSEKVALGNSTIAGLTAQIDGNIIDLNAADDVTIDAGGDIPIVAVGTATLQGGTVNIGGAGNGDVLVASTGTRDITIGSANATSVDINSAHGRIQLASGNAEITTSSSGIAYITDGATRYFEANYGNQTITVSDGTNSILIGSSGITMTGNTGVTGNITVTGTVDGVDLSTLAGTANGEGASQIGVEDTGTYYTGTDVEAVLQEIGASLGTIPANANDLADVDTTGVADGNLLQYVASNSAFEVATPATVVGGAAIGDLSNVDGAATPTNGQVLKYNTSTSLWAPADDTSIGALNDISDVDAGSPTDGQVLTWVAANSAWEAQNTAATYADADAISAVEGESTLDLTGDVTIDGDLTVDMGGSGNTSGRVMVGSQSEAAETADLTGVYSVKVGTAQQVPLSAGTRVHVRVAATINRVGAPTEELFLAINMEDSGGNTGSTFATKNLGGINSHQSEVVIHATLLITDATSANSAERDHLMTGLFHADVSGTVTVGSMRNFDTGTHSPVAYSGGGLEKVNVGTAYDRIRISAESGANTQTVADHYEFNVKAITVDFSKGE